MKSLAVRALALVILAPAALASVPSRATAQHVLVEGDRAVAYTFDDLPATRFTSLDDARDEYVGPRGPSWLERWARTQGREVGAPPPLPRWVRDAGRY